MVRLTYAGAAKSARRYCRAMRTLFISHIVPYPLNSGTPQRVFHLLKALSRISDITFVCPTPRAERTAELAALQPLCASMFLYPSPTCGPRRKNPPFSWLEWKLRYLYPVPLEIQFARSPSGASLIRRLQPEIYDLVWVERLMTMQLLPARALSCVVVDIDGVRSGSLAGRLRRGRPYRGMQYELLEYLKWRRLERRLHSLPYTFAVCSEEDKTLISREARVEVIPNGIDFPGEEKKVPQQTQRPVFLFLGTLNYSPNVDAVEYFVGCIWPRILEAAPSAQFLIVGRDPDPAIRRLHDGKRIVVTGTVPDTEPYFRQAAAMVVPLRFGAGTRIKVLEAWARRVPVVTTRLGAEGLGAEHGVHLLMAESPARFAQACLRLLEDRALSERLSRTGYVHAREYYSWERIEGRVQQLARVVADVGLPAAPGRDTGEQTPSGVVRPSGLWASRDPSSAWPS
jgi:glycosyltransferase involved in cell wall biosynthesis